MVTRDSKKVFILKEEDGHLLSVKKMLNSSKKSFIIGLSYYIINVKIIFIIINCS